MRVLVLGVALASVFVGASGRACGEAGGRSGDVAQPLPKGWTVITSNGGSYTLAWVAEPAPVPVGALFDLEVRLLGWSLLAVLGAFLIE